MGLDILAEKAMPLCPAIQPDVGCAQYQIQRQQHAALAGLVIADDHIPAGLERKRQRRTFTEIFETSALERNRVHQKADLDI